MLSFINRLFIILPRNLALVNKILLEDRLRAEKLCENILISYCQKIDVPPHLENAVLEGARFLDARKIFYGFFCTENCKFKQFSCAQEATAP